MAPLLIFTGYAFLLVGGLLMLVAAFRQSVLWGLACLFVPVVSLFFLIVHWHAAKNAFAVQLIGGALVVLGLILAPSSHHGVLV
jgi:hypothetical protein